MIFKGFTLERVDVGEVELRVRHGGSGPPLLLLHGHPRTHATWHEVAPLLADRFTVVCPDLRGYGGSGKPPTDAEHTPYSKRAMAQDAVALMRALGHGTFAVAGHDRGALVAFRTAMDHPRAVTALLVMDGLPVVEHLERCDARFAAAWWHWWFFGQTAKPAERVINADPDAWYATTGEHMAPEAWADFQEAIHDPATGRGGAGRGGRGDPRVPRSSRPVNGAVVNAAECPPLCGVKRGQTLLASTKEARSWPLSPSWPSVRFCWSWRSCCRGFRDIRSAAPSGRWASDRGPVPRRRAGSGAC
ncbi:alpha/beta fold hydrolase [Actinomadura algeriensis]|uniref:Pimeloyl-ACP methyl ester carboxylesterase n=1 Tax=Actinomadura algeriensis TaxID=1679523 RepID=A0ABR9JJU8_9ACTN|nr:alpha/beta hydrolase [Actinomadura algeriensis]MBE1530825.1 pimeloyl-ACP methyl ester carboxylesterase [Actinomadura algeriensis]